VTVPRDEDGGDHTADGNYCARRQNNCELGVPAQWFHAFDRSEAYGTDKFFLSMS